MGRAAVDRVPAVTPRLDTLTGPPLDPRIVELSGQTLVELLDLAAARSPETLALVLRRGLRDERWTVRELQRNSRRVAATLAGMGVAPGDRVVTWGSNEPWLVAAYFGIWRAGASCVPLDLRMRADVAERIVRRTRPRLVLAMEGPARETSRELGWDVELIGPGLGRLGAAEAPRIDVTPETVAEIVCTSGTTSDPKGVVLTHRQVIHSARVIAQTGMGSRPERALSVIPLSHMYGQIVPLFLSLISGSTLVFQPTLNAQALIATMERERITAVTAVPQLVSIMNTRVESAAAREGSLERLQRARRLTRHLPMRLRRWPFRRVHQSIGGHLGLITSGGSALPAALQRAWEDMGVRVVQGYGGTECAAITGHTRDSRRTGSAGMPLAGLEVRIARDGELLVRGPSVMRGYWEAPEATIEVLDADGWLHTGDAARIEDGEIIILGRTRDRIALPNGLKVYPEDVEAALLVSDAIRSAVVLEESPGRLAAVLLAEDEAVADDALDAAVETANNTLAPHQRLRRWRRWPEPDLPRTHTLKIRRESVRAWLRQVEQDARPSEKTPPPAVPSSITPAGPITPAVDRLGSLCEVVASFATTPGQPPPRVEGSTRLEDLGIDSLARVELAIHLEDVFQTRLVDEDLESARDIADLSARMEASSVRATPPRTRDWAVGPLATLLREALDRTVIDAAIRLMADPVVEGHEHLQAVAGPVLICPNHTSHLDAPVVRWALPPPRRRRTAIAAAADYFFTGRLPGALIAAAMGAFPFGRRSDVRLSLERIVDLLADDWTVILFPEGTRSMDGRLGPMHQGIGLLATSVAVPIIPVHISGTHELLPKGQTLPRRRRGSRVRVRFGAAIDIDSRLSPREATRIVGAAIAELGSEP